MPTEGADLLQALAPFARSLELVVALDRDLRVVGRNPAELARGGESVEHFPIAVLAEAIARGEPRSFEWGDRGPGGVNAWYLASVTPIVDRDAIAGVLISSRDITTLKQAEERLRRSEQLMVDTQGVAHLGIWEWDISEPHVTWSDELYRIYDLTRESYTPSYEGYLAMVHPEDRQRVIDATNRVFHENVPYSHDERIVRPDGSIRYLHTWAHPVRDQAGALVKLVGVCQDITDRMAAEETVRRLNAELEQRVAERTQQLELALRDLETFNSMVSHDLRAPLAVMQMAIELLDAELPPALAPGLDRIRRAVGTMSQLVAALLAFARAGHKALQVAEVDVHALCRELVTEQQAVAAREVEVEIAIARGPSLRVDPALVRVAFANLIGNAWKYTARTEAPRIEIGVVTRPEGKALYVRDNGIGFAMTEHDLLFRPFSRLTNASDFKGTGIGLATVERIVERHGGTIRAEGAVGRGATFFLILPPDAWLVG